MSAVSADRSLEPPAPQWVAPVWEMREGRDPLGLQTTTTDRLLPVLLPGLIELSQQARYFAFYAFLLAQYEQRQLGGSRAELDRFVRRCEWDYGLAVLSCERCESSPQGALRLRPVINAHDGSGVYPRGESVQSTLGGYGLYYRAPMNELGLIAREGSLLGGEPIPIDVLARTARAGTLAATFEDAITDTAYHRQGWIVRREPLPRDVVEDYAEVACLCRLSVFPNERDAIQDALFGRDPTPAVATAGDDSDPTPAHESSSVETGVRSAVEPTVDAVTQRGRSVAHFLTLIDATPEVVDSQSAYRQALWDSPGERSPAQQRVAGQWAALVVKDVWQEALCSVWTSFCRKGLARFRELGHPLDPPEVEAVARALIIEPPALPPNQASAAVADALGAGQVRVRVPAGALGAGSVDDAEVDVDPAALTMEQLRRTCVALDSATYGLIALLELSRRVHLRSGPGWAEAVSIGSTWQPSVAAAAAALREHLRTDPTVADTLWWLTRRHIVDVHERIAYSKLPQRMFTFRFRWEDARLRFYDQGMGRFTLAAARHAPLVQLTGALGLWERADPDASAALTARGRAFIDEHLPA